MSDATQWLQLAAEVIKVVGGIASFYAVFKLRQIERRYLFKATIPQIKVRIEDALSALNSAREQPSAFQVEISEALNCLMVDVKNVRRKASGDTLNSCKDVLAAISALRPGRHWWNTRARASIRRCGVDRYLRQGPRFGAGA